jgi:hypothetical protein
MSASLLFSWLHISDIHARHGGPDHRLGQRVVLADLHRSLERLPDGLARVDAIFVTGDLAFSGGMRDPAEYNDVAELLRHAAATLEVPANRLFVVPGNHDVDRGVAKAKPELLDHLAKLRRGAASLLERPAGLEADFQARLAGWRALVERAAPHLAPRLDVDGGWSLDLEGATGAPLRLVGLNTALLSQDDDDRGSLRIGRRQAQPLFEPGRVVIALGHHPLSWLGDPTDLLGPIRRWTDVYLHGHVHRQASTAVLQGGGDLHVTGVAGAAHLDENEAGALRHAYTFGAFVGGSGSALKLRSWPRAYDPERGFISDACNCIPEKNYAELPVPKRLTWAPAAPSPTPTTATAPTPTAAVTVMASPPSGPQLRPSIFRPPLEVYVVWHPNSQAAGELASQLYGSLHRSVDDPFGHDSLGIPVFFRSVAPAGHHAPLAIDLERADATAIVALLDGTVAGEHGAALRAYLGSVASECRHVGGRRRLVPVCLDGRALKIPALNAIHFVRADQDKGIDQIDRVVNGVVHHLTRLMRVAPEAREEAVPPPPIEVFLSHARLDGAPIAERLRRFLLDGTGIEAFLDQHDIAAAWAFVSQIAHRIAAEHVVFLAVLTDAFASREWCRTEIATARTERRPILVIDARAGAYTESLPFLGHAPMLRWQPEDSDFWRALLRLILREALRFAYVPAYLASVERLWQSSSEGSVHVPRRPDLVDVVSSDCRRLLHPDPPLVPEEARLFRRPFRSLALVTPSTLSLVP